ncbi:MAG TPA: quinolinate synthase [Clostridiales bacterium]|nr:quinolinate synthase [Clostridiales bacterium]
MNQLAERIEQLKKEKDVVVLAHFYVEDEVQDIADYIGDSYYLSKIAADVPQSTILFCGVRFMGESAKILSPEKTILMPDLTADCPMAHMITPEDVRAMRKKYPGSAVVCYINSTSETKAVSDVIVTSANAKKIVESLPNEDICFIPDCNLGRFLQKDMPGKRFHFHNGCCPIHARVTPEGIAAAKAEHPDAKVLIHPECVPEAVAMSDYAGSTSGIIKYATESDAKEFIIVTEPGVMHRLRTSNPDKIFYPFEQMGVCEDMKKITMEKVLHVLETFDNQVEMPDQLREDAKSALVRMRELAQ